MQRMQFLVICCLVIMGTVLELKAESAASQFPLEANAIINSGWWNASSQSDPHHICSWEGIVCNNAGSITTIKYSDYIEGEIATLNFSAFKNLEWLELSILGLEGTIPPEIGNLSKLTHLDLSYNFLEGEMPPSLGNLTQLKTLIISNNRISGNIPPELMLMKNLTVLDLSYNKFNGTLPVSLSNLTKLEKLDISHNLLSGSLKALSVGSHAQLTTITQKTGYLPKLAYLDLSYNYLDGEIPPSLGNFTQLESLFISNNNFHGSIPRELGCLKHLTALDLSYNKIQGSISAELMSLKSLTVLDLSHNKIQGSVPHELVSLKNLTELDISNNRINGTLTTLMNLTKLTRLDISNNLIVGSLKSLSIGTHAKLIYLNMSQNYLDGEIPPSLGNLTQLRILAISNNNIQGFIPTELMFLKNLTLLDLSHNKFNGTLPMSLSNLTKLENLDISNNLLAGSLKPLTLGSLTKLATIYLSHNLISGEIPSELPYHTPSLESLDLSYNNLTGTVPLFLQPIPYLDISYNCLNGSIPNDFPPQILIGNKGICTDIMDIQTKFKFQPCSTHDNKVVMAHHKKVTQNKLVIVLPILFFLIMVFLLFVYLRYIRVAIKNKHSKTMATTKNGDLFCMWKYDGSIAYEDIIRVTEDFDMKYCIGTGAYGSVYKAQLPSGKIVALKKLHGFEAEVSAFDESFRNEVKVLSEIKHRHIVKLYGYCLHKRNMFLIYQYMERGSLFSFLYYDVEAIEMDWRKRVNIVKGTAHALSYLHHDCTPPIVHRDISASNILLNSEWEPSVGDFGTARFLRFDSSNRTIVAGTIGYIAPDKLFISFKS